MKVMCIGAAVMDITALPVPSEELWKEKQWIDNISVQTGGDAANQAAHLADLGFEPLLSACVGADTNGEMFRAALRARGVDVDLVRAKEGMNTSMALVLVNGNGERHIFTAPGAYDTICLEDLPARIPEGVRALSLGSIFNMPKLEESGLSEYLGQAKQRGIPVFADLVPDKKRRGLPWVERFLPLIDYFLPSLYEAEDLTGKRGEEACAALLREKGAGHVIIKCGERGCYIDSPDFTGRVEALKVEPVDTTGAGDCMVAFFIRGILMGEDIETACRNACRAASLSTLHPGAAVRILPEE